MEGWTCGRTCILLSSVHHPSPPSIPAESSRTCYKRSDGRPIRPHFRSADFRQRRAARHGGCLGRRGGGDRKRLPTDEVERAVDALNAAYRAEGRAFRIHRWAGGFRMATAESSRRSSRAAPGRRPAAAEPGTARNARRRRLPAARHQARGGPRARRAVGPRAAEAAGKRLCRSHRPRRRRRPPAALRHHARLSGTLRPRRPRRAAAPARDRRAPRRPRLPARAARRIGDLDADALSPDGSADDELPREPTARADRPDGRRTFCA